MNIGEKSMLLDGLDEAFDKKSWTALTCAERFEE